MAFREKFYLCQTFKSGIYMATFLFEDIIFGPVISRRLGASLGINLLPGNRKICNFNCIYCECGWTDETNSSRHNLPSRKELRSLLELRLLEMKEKGEDLDTITFAGNGEPTIHPDFPGIIDDTINLRNQIFPEVKIAVLSNSSKLDDPEVFSALLKIEQAILKLDSANANTVGTLNRPAGNYSVEKVIRNLEKFEGRFILQTLFVNGTHEGVVINNSTDLEINAWLEVVEKLKPELVMVYTIARDTPLETLSKVSADKLDHIAEEVRKLGIAVTVSY